MYLPIRRKYFFSFLQGIKIQFCFVFTTTLAALKLAHVLNCSDLCMYV